MTDEPQATDNTDVHLWTDKFDDSVHYTQDGGLGLNVGGYVIVMPIFEWHRLATNADNTPFVDAPNPVTSGDRDG